VTDSLDNNIGAFLKAPTSVRTIIHISEAYQVKNYNKKDFDPGITGISYGAA